MLLKLGTVIIGSILRIAIGCDGCSPAVAAASNRGSERRQREPSVDTPADGVASLAVSLLFAAVVALAIRGAGMPHTLRQREPSVDTPADGVASLAASLLFAAVVALAIRGAGMPHTR